MDNAKIAAIVALQLVVLAILQYVAAAWKDRKDDERQRRIKEEDYRRQDLVAERAKTAHDADVRRTEEVARLAAQADARIQSQLTEINDQGRKIHTLVNSDMTAARTNERDQTKLTLIALKRVQALSLSLGIAVTEEEVKAITAAEERIEELNQILADRLAAQARIDAEEATKTP